MVFPTHVGVYLLISDRTSPESAFSPHTWGCTVQADGSDPLTVVFPTHVGVYRKEVKDYEPILGFPHTRGGVPMIYHHLNLNHGFSPHTWGCTCGHQRAEQAFQVFPTHVGVYLAIGVNQVWKRCFPHTRGGVPEIETVELINALFSPHTWGCTYNPDSICLLCRVFPTHVGVYLTTGNPRNR